MTANQQSTSLNNIAQGILFTAVDCRKAFNKYHHNFRLGFSGEWKHGVLT